MRRTPPWEDSTLPASSSNSLDLAKIAFMAQRRERLNRFNFGHFQGRNVRLRTNLRSG